ncbi:MAG: hypothetical protein WKG07_03265 [Hymenobacter sp.]
MPLALLPLGLGLSYALGRGLFREFRRAFGRTSWEALGVQGRKCCAPGRYWLPWARPMARCCPTCWYFWPPAWRRCCRSRWVA